MKYLFFVLIYFCGTGHSAESFFVDEVKSFYAHYVHIKTVKRKKFLSEANKRRRANMEPIFKRLYQESKELYKSRPDNKQSQKYKQIQRQIDLSNKNSSHLRDLCYNGKLAGNESQEIVDIIKNEIRLQAKYKTLYKKDIARAKVLIALKASRKNLHGAEKSQMDKFLKDLQKKDFSEETNQIIKTIKLYSHVWKTGYSTGKSSKNFQINEYGGTAQFSSEWCSVRGSINQYNVIYKKDSVFIKLPNNKIATVKMIADKNVQYTDPGGEVFIFRKLL